MRLKKLIQANGSIDFWFSLCAYMNEWKTVNKLWRLLPLFVMRDLGTRWQTNYYYLLFLFGL